MDIFYCRKRIATTEKPKPPSIIKKPLFDVPTLCFAPFQTELDAKELWKILSDQILNPKYQEHQFKQIIDVRGKFNNKHKGL